MKRFTVVIAATAAILAGGMLSSNPSHADFNGGGPVRSGNMCWMSTSANDHGYWKGCERPMRHERHVRHMEKR